MKQHLFMGSESSFNETLNQALQLEVAKMADGSPVRLGPEWEHFGQ